MAKTSQIFVHSECYWVKTIHDIDAEAYELGTCILVCFLIIKAEKKAQNKSSDWWKRGKYL